MTNVTAPATGSSFGTRTITAVEYPYSIPGTVVGGAFTEISAAAPMPVSLADYTATLPTLDATLTTSALVVTPNGYRGGAFDIGALAGGAVIVFEQLATATSTTWDALNLIPLGGGAQVTSTAAAGRFEFIAAGVYRTRARVGTAGTGTIVVSVQLTSGQKLMRVFNTNRANVLTNATLQINGTDNAAGNPAFVSVTNTVPVSGAFFQTTQPVSIASMPSTPVTGTFFQTTQPVSGTVAVNGTTTVAAANIFRNETSTALTAATTFTGTTRDTGVAAGTATGYTYFNASFVADQAGTVYVDASNDGTTFYLAATSAMAINTPLLLSVPIVTRYYRTRVLNGAVAQTALFVNSSFTAA